MSVLHSTTTNDDVLRRAWSAATVSITARLDSNTVIACMEDTVLDKHVLARLRVTAVTVRTIIDDLATTHGYILAKNRMDNPERRAEEGNAIHEDILALIEIDELRTHSASQAEDALLGRNVVVSHPKECVAVAQHLTL
jgi:hypothetical protein